MHVERVRAELEQTRGVESLVRRFIGSASFAIDTTARGGINYFPPRGKW